MVINNYFECLAKSAKLLNTAFFASLADLARTLKKFSYNYLKEKYSFVEKNSCLKNAGMIMSPV